MIRYFKDKKFLREYYKSLSIKKSDKVFIKIVGNPFLEKKLKSKIKNIKTVDIKEDDKLNKIILYNFFSKMNTDQKKKMISYLLKKLDHNGELNIFEHLINIHLFEFINILESFKIVRYKYIKTKNIQFFINKGEVLK